MKVGDSVRLTDKAKKSYPQSDYNPHDIVGQLTASRGGRLYVSWGDGKSNAYSEHELEKPENEVELKKEFEIFTTNENFRANVLTLQALGYPIFCSTMNDALGGKGMGTFKSICRRSESDSSDKDVQRGSMCGSTNSFKTIGDFLIYHFTPTKTKAQTEMEALQVKMEEMQAQMEKLKEAVDNE